MNRKEKIDRLKEKKEIPVLVVGAGVNGVGVYRELALQGITTLLIDKADISAGASAASSRMIHGGLRYLENNEVKLVKESLAERNGLLLNAPHYIKPLPTTIPIFNWFSGMLNAIPKFFGVSSKNVPRGAVIVKIGLMMYDLLPESNASCQHTPSMVRKSPWPNDRIYIPMSYVQQPTMMHGYLIRNGCVWNWFKTPMRWEQIP